MGWGGICRGARGPSSRWLFPIGVTVAVSQNGIFAGILWLRSAPPPLLRHIALTEGPAGQ
jgi:hypothetical protein